MNSEYVMAGLFAVVILGAVCGVVWFRKHPDAD